MRLPMYRGKNHFESDWRYSELRQLFTWAIFFHHRRSPHDLRQVIMRNQET